MITRIVKLTFYEDKMEDFKQLFEYKREKIKAFEGCLGVELLKDVEKPNILFTYSLWEKPEHLEVYRKSTFFRETWAVAKTYFKEPAEAWSLTDYRENG